MESWDDEKGSLLGVAFHFYSTIEIRFELHGTCFVMNLVAQARRLIAVVLN